MTFPTPDFVVRSGDDAAVYRFQAYDADGGRIRFPDAEDSVVVCQLGGLTVDLGVELDGAVTVEGLFSTQFPSTLVPGWYAIEFRYTVGGVSMTYPLARPEIVLVRERAYDLGGTPTVDLPPGSVPTYIQPTQPNLPGQTYVWINSTTGEQFFEDGLS